MIYRIRTAVVILVLVSARLYCASGDGSFKAPDSLVFKDGRTVYGVIIKNTVDSVIFQEDLPEKQDSPHSR